MGDRYELQLKAGEDSWLTLQTAGLLDPIEKAFNERYEHMKQYDYRVVKYTEEELYVASEIREAGAILDMVTSPIIDLP